MFMPLTSRNMKTRKNFMENKSKANNSNNINSGELTMRILDEIDK